MTSKGKTPSIVGAATFIDAKMQFHERVKDKVLAAALLRLYFAQLSAKETYYAQLPAASPIVPITAEQWKDWRTPAHPDENVFLIEKVEDVETILITERVKLPRATQSDKKIYETVAKNLIQAAHLILTNTLYDAYEKQDGFKTFATTPAYIAYKSEHNILSKTMVDNHTI